MKKSLLLLSFFTASAVAQVNNNVIEPPTYPHAYIFENHLVSAGEDVHNATIKLVADNGCDITGGSSWDLYEEIVGHELAKVNMEPHVSCSLGIELNIKNEDQSHTVIPMDIAVKYSELQYPELTDAAKQLMIKKRVTVQFSKRDMVFKRGSDNDPTCVVWEL